MHTQGEKESLRELRLEGGNVTLLRRKKLEQYHLGKYSQQTEGQTER
jgi:hypothetical protein